MIDELRADATKTRKDGTRGRLRIDYGGPKQPEAALKWVSRYIDGAKSAGELFRGSIASTGVSVVGV